MTPDKTRSMENVSVQRDSHLIDGQWNVPGPSLPVLDPSNGQEFHAVARGTAADVDAAVASAKAAFPSWARRSASERGTILGRWAQLMYANVEALAALEAQDVGKPLSDARTNIYIAASIAEYFAGAADKLQGVTLPSRSTETMGFTLREPLGVCGLLIAWNVPSVLMLADVAPALAAGNTVVLKPSENAPLAPMALAMLAIEAGLPPGVLNVVNGLGPDVGEPLTMHPDLAHLSFVGSTATGRRIMVAAAKNLTPVKLELGGKSANVVFADADLDRAVPQLVEAITENAGQNCNAGSRLLVERSIQAELVERLAVALGGWQEDLDMGPVINRAQYDRIASFVDLGTQEQARLVIGGTVADAGWFVRPILFDGVTPNMRLFREEVFGPVLTVTPFDSLDEAIALTNATEYGLQTAIWTQDLTKAMTMVREAKTGQIAVNEYTNTTIIGYPFNVTKNSGFSRGGGYAAMLEYTHEKAVSIRI
jgi:aldehyde dehydrogenase (NAD+)